MATNPDVLELVAILDAEGFGDVAGLLLAEVALGREFEVSRAAPGSVALDELGSEVADTDIRREPIAEADQFAFAMAFLRERLVIPIRQLAEAERIAGEIAGTKPPPIRFVRYGPAQDETAAFTGMSGDDSLANELENLLQRLPTSKIPPEPSAT